MSLRTKILSTLFAFMFLVFILLTANLLLELPARSQQLTRQQGELAGRLVYAWAADAVGRLDPDGPEFWRELESRLGGTSSLFERYAVVESRGAELYVRISRPRGGGLDAEERRRIAAVVEDGGTRVEGDAAYVALGAVGGRRLCAKFVLPSGSAAAADLTHTVTGVVVIMGIGILVILLTTYVLLHRFVLRPLNRLSDASASVAAGDYSKLLPEPAAHDEVARTFRAFNLMLRRLDEYNRHLMGEIHKSQAELSDTRTKLVRAQRLSSTGTLAAGIAHEINNPLSGLINMAQELRSASLPPDRRERYLELIIEGLDRIRATVDRILLFVPRPVAVRDVRLEEVIQKVSALVAHRLSERRVALEVRGVGSLPALRGDPAELQQVFLNLVLNSIDAASADGSGRIEIVGEADGKYIEVQVVDNGVGMGPEELQKAFLPFQTSKEEGKGTGLGLPIARSIVESYGGDIYIESEKGAGAKVHVILPWAQEKEKIGGRSPVRPEAEQRS